LPTFRRMTASIFMVEKWILSVRSSDMSVTFYHNIRVPEGTSVHSHCNENLKSRKWVFVYREIFLEGRLSGQPLSGTVEPGKSRIRTRNDNH
jgi:hypothetical protein